jgi:putative ABC transport system permease protein
MVLILLKSWNQKNTNMFKNFFIIALRGILKNKLFAAINIIGLAIGISASLIIFQYAFNELSYDKFNEDSENIYRIRNERYSQGELAENMATACNACGNSIKEAFPEVEEHVLLSNFQLEGIISYEDVKYRLEKAFFATDGFFKVFSYKLLKGDPQNILTEPNTIVISESLAKKYFRDEDPIGKMLRYNNGQSLEVVGVFKDVPYNSHLKFDLLISYETMINNYGEWIRDSWMLDIAFTYVKLKPDTDIFDFETKINQLVQERTGEELKKNGEDMKLFLQSLEEIHLYSNYPGEAETNGDAKIVYFLLIISLSIIIIAWVNYINLSTARSIERAKEVGLRKVSGARKNQLVFQFLIESFILNIIAVLISLGIVDLAIPLFNDYTGLELSMTLFRNLNFWILFLLVITFGSILSGLYPAFVISSHKPISVLKGKLRSTTRGILFRKILIIFQFIISILLISGTLTVYKQVDYMRTQDLGFDLNQTLIFKGPLVFDSTWIQKNENFKVELRTNPNIEDVCASYFVPGDEVWFTMGFERINNNPNKSRRTLQANFIDDDFMNFYNFEFLDGRNFDETIQTDLISFILNRTAMELLGYQTPEEAVNDDLHNVIWNNDKKIIGVIENYHQTSLKESYTPLIYILLPRPRWSKNYSIIIKTENINETIEFIEKKYASFFPGNIFEYYFLDKHYNQQYKSDILFGKVFAAFSILAIVIACLGLFALALFYMLQRMFEIAIRKVHGASIKSIFTLLSSEYIRLFGISLLIGFPLSFWMMKKWLENYAYQVQIGIWFFIIPILLMILIILISISYLVFEAARKNPSDVLKYE